MRGSYKSWRHFLLFNNEDQIPARAWSVSKNKDTEWSWSVTLSQGIAKKSSVELQALKGVEMSVKDKCVARVKQSESDYWLIWLLPRQPASPSTACCCSLALSFLGHLTEPLDDKLVVTKCKFNVHKATAQPWPILYLLPVAVSRRQHSLHSHFPATVRPSQGQERHFSAVSTCQWLSADAVLQEQFPRFTSSTSLKYFDVIRHSCCEVVKHLNEKYECHQPNTRGSALHGSAETCATAVITGTSHACHESPKRCWEAVALSTLMALRVRLAAGWRTVKCWDKDMWAPWRCIRWSLCSLHTQTQNHQRTLTQLLGVRSHKCRHGIFREKVPG